jgi:hypothetical protein
MDQPWHLQELCNGKDLPLTPPLVAPRPNAERAWTRPWPGSPDMHTRLEILRVEVDAGDARMIERASIAEQKRHADVALREQLVELGRSQKRTVERELRLQEHEAELARFKAQEY